MIFRISGGFALIFIGLSLLGVVNYVDVITAILLLVAGIALLAGF